MLPATIGFLSVMLFFGGAPELGSVGLFVCAIWLAIGGSSENNSQQVRKTEVSEMNGNLPALYRPYGMVRDEPNFFSPFHGSSTTIVPPSPETVIASQDVGIGADVLKHLSDNEVIKALVNSGAALELGKQGFGTEVGTIEYREGFLGPRVRGFFIQPRRR